jgi:hypothetical protein
MGLDLIVEGCAKPGHEQEWRQLLKRSFSGHTRHRETKATAPVLAWFAPPGSNRDGGRGNEAVGAFDSTRH